MKLLKANQKGFSLIELIVIIAILGLAGVASMSMISSLYGGRATSAADEFDSMLKQTRASTISGRANELYITMQGQEIQIYKVDLDNDGYEVDVLADKEKLDSNIEVTFFLSDGTETNTAPKISYDRETGEFNPAEFNPINETGAPIYVERISFVTGGRTATVDLVIPTGFSEVN